VPRINSPFRMTRQHFSALVVCSEFLWSPASITISSSEMTRLSSARPELVLCSNCQRVLEPQYHIGTPGGPSNSGRLIYNDSRIAALRALRESAELDCPLCVVLWDSFNDHIGDATDIWEDENAFSIRLGMFQRNSSSIPDEAHPQEYFLRYDISHSRSRIPPF
jgi:hypothetical protein